MISVTPPPVPRGTLEAELHRLRYLIASKYLRLLEHQLRDNVFLHRWARSDALKAVLMEIKVC